MRLVLVCVSWPKHPPVINQISSKAARGYQQMRKKTLETELIEKQKYYEPKFCFKNNNILPYGTSQTYFFKQIQPNIYKISYYIF